MEKVIFEEDIGDRASIDMSTICDAKISGTMESFELSCFKGKLKIEGDITTQFWTYHNWCGRCDKIHIIKKEELQNVAKSFARNVAKEIDKIKR